MPTSYGCLEHRPRKNWVCFATRRSRRDQCQSPKPLRNCALTVCAWWLSMRFTILTCMQSQRPVHLLNSSLAVQELLSACRKTFAAQGFFPASKTPSGCPTIRDALWSSRVALLGNLWLREEKLLAPSCKRWRYAYYESANKLPPAFLQLKASATPRFYSA